MTDMHGTDRDRPRQATPDLAAADRNPEGGIPTDPLDRRLDESLHRLPRETARLGFTTRVLANLDRPHARKASRSWLSRWPALLAVGAALVIAAVAGREWWHQQRLQESFERIATLRVEQRALEEELLQLRQLVSDAKPVLHLGSDHDVDWVLDLRRLRQGDRIVLPDALKQGLAERQGVLPASIPRGEVRPANLQTRPTY